jgi:selenide,water dikinase
VYKLDDTRALVQTVDFFTPIVDDPIAYGRIAAANALSDVYAMGGRPLTALAIAAFPKDGDRSVLSAIFHGGLHALQEAGVALLGGHTVQDLEIKFGYAVTGEVDPSRIWSNAGARAGDALVLTKPIGTGVIATAIKFGRAPEAVAMAAIASMSELNRAAADALGGFPPIVHARTDITDSASSATRPRWRGRAHAQIDVAVPLLDGALDLVDGNTPGGGRTNVQHFGAGVSPDQGLDARRVQLLYDPQTSGGLLAAVAASGAAAAVRALAESGVTAHVIGSVEAGHAVAVRLR